jgi:uncharacterized protein
MIPILVASNTGYAGRTFLSLGLAMKLKEMGHTVGFMKPIGTMPIKSDGGVHDADALFIKDVLELDEPLEAIAPFMQTYENQTLLYQGKIKDAQKDVLSAFKSLKKKDFVILCGSGDFFEGSLLGLDTFSLASALKAQVLMVEPWRGDASVDALFGARKLLGDRFAGGVLNKIPANMVDHIKETVKPFLEQKGVPVFGVIP